MIRQTLFQLFKNRLKLVSLVIILSLSFIVISIITTMAYNPVYEMINLRYNLKFENIHRVGLTWDNRKTDSLALINLHNNYENILIKEFGSQSIAKAYGSLIRNRFYHPLSRYHQDYGVAYCFVPENFDSFFNVELVRGNGFDRVNTETDNVIPIIVNKSIYNNKFIDIVNDQIEIALYDSINNYRIVGVVDDIEINYRNRSIQDVIFLKGVPNRLQPLNTANYFVKSNSMTNEEVKNRILTQMEQSGIKNNLLTIEVHNEQSFKEEGVKEVIEEFRLIISIIVLIVLFVVGTVFGLLYKYTLARFEEFAIRRAFGCSLYKLFKQLYLEILIISAVAIVFGTAIFLNLTTLLDTRNGPNPILEGFLIASATIFVVSTLAGAVPLIKALNRLPSQDLKSI